MAKRGRRHNLYFNLSILLEFTCFLIRINAVGIIFVIVARGLFPKPVLAQLAIQVTPKYPNTN